MAKKILKKEKFNAFMESIKGKGSRFVAPTMDARQVVYKPVQSADEVVFDYVLPRNSVKEFMFPQTEVVARYSTLGETTLEGADPAGPHTVIFGVRPCDAASLKSMMSVFTWDFVDEFYTKKADAALIITVSCTQGDEECFCTTVGGSPNGTDGSDLALTETEEGDFLVEPVTDKGKEFVKTHAKVFDNAKEPRTKKLFEPEKIPGVDLQKISKKLANTDHYADAAWEEMARKCIGCGACTFACPTCHCFDIVDEGTAYEGERRKNWDACQFDHFTLHASGHNPRDVQHKRWRNRFMCKFNFYPEKFSSTGCVGCGRCIKVCPVRLDITEVMERMSQ